MDSNLRAKLYTIDGVWVLQGAVVGHAKGPGTVVGVQLPAFPLGGQTFPPLYGHHCRLGTVELQHYVEHLTKKNHHADTIFVGTYLVHPFFIRCII